MNDIYGDFNVFYCLDLFMSCNMNDEQDDGFLFKCDRYNDYIVQFGGFVVKDKFFYFFLYQCQEDGFFVVGSDFEIVIVVQEFDCYFGKLNYQVSVSYLF